MPANRLNVLHVITSLEDGGAEAVLYRLALSSNLLCYQTVVSLRGGGKYGALLQAAGVMVHCLDMPKGRLTFSGLWRLWRLIRQVCPEVVQTWMFHANLLGGVAARAAGVRQIYWGIHHTTLIPGTTGASTRIVDWLCARLSGIVPTKIIACAQMAKNTHIERGYAPTKFTIVPNGYDIEQFRPSDVARAQVRRELSVPNAAPVIGLVGRWDPQKDHANLIQAVRLVRQTCPDLHLLLVGNGCTTKNEELVKLLEEAGLIDGIHMLGRRNDVANIMNTLDMHVLSSYNEAFPNVVAEAMACGVPCVVTQVGDAPVIVGDTGWVVPARDAEALADAIIHGLTELRDSVGWSHRKQEARRRIKSEFSLEIMTRRYQDVWSSE